MSHTEAIDTYFTETIAAFTETIATLHDRDAEPATAVPLLDLFDAQLGSRHLDLAARELRADGHGFYTIGSSGHESNAAVAAALRPTDPALLHYRSGAFFIARAAQVGGSDPLRDVLLGVVAAAADPSSGGRHKVFGRVDLEVIPQTSTIASHLPRAVGVAFSIDRATRLGVPVRWPADSIAVCSFGDASANHSTATGAINAALHAAYQGVPMPLLLICEDNGIGISTRTPPGWINRAFGSREGLEYFAADGSDVVAVFDAARRAAEYVRTRRRPAFLHLRTVRLMGHAGSDYEAAYRTPADIVADYARDPVVCTAKQIVRQGILRKDAVLERYEAKRAEVARLADEVSRLPKLADAAAVMAPIFGTQRATPAAVRAHPTAHTLAQAINIALADILADHPEAILFGEDVARKGGVYGVTRGLWKRFGSARVFDTLLDEQSILGLALGAGTAGLLPIPEIQYLAYLHNAADQIRGEGATLPFFSARSYGNPMVVRIAGYGYQKGFGGHFHNDNAVAALRDIPGIVVASPARPDDAAAMLQACVAARTLCLFLEPIALYHTRDLYEPGDEKWLTAITSDPVPIGQARVHGTGADLTIITFGNGLRMSLRVAQRLSHISCRVVDLRWLVPLPVDDILRAARATGRVLVVDETRKSGGVAEGVIAALVDAGFTGSIARVTSADSFIPLGDAARHVLLSEATIEAAIAKIMT